MIVGTVYLVGAGPGAPGLITVRGLDLIRAAEVIVYDRLVSPALIEEAPQSAQRIFAGKTAGYHSLPQEEINAVLIEHARAGRKVVRLKGGDPFVFGRGGEEVEALAEAGVPYEVIPGVSAATAVPAYAGIPLTHRRLSSSFAVITGHEACKPGARVDWTRLATAVDTLVVLMGLTNLARIAAALIAHGRAAETPAAVVSCGTTPRQRVVIGTLDDITEKAKLVPPPAVIVVGEVVGLVDDPVELVGAARPWGVAVHNGKPSASKS
ncbi:MAG TPA: uroporphyrinogen-III C-methyltransferase [Candidatus Binatia bacterium]|nr:uroporphyrinogen-III C-methyltransferase [Candidatus Binatia bacterium]